MPLNQPEIVICVISLFEHCQHNLFESTFEDMKIKRSSKSGQAKMIIRDDSTQNVESNQTQRQLRGFLLLRNS